MIVDIKTPEEIVTLIKSWDRIGCEPFKYIKEDVFFNYNHYELKEFHWKSDFVQWEAINGYGVDYKRRIDRKSKTEEERDKYYKVYSKEIPPVILDHKGYPLDGYHRLARHLFEKVRFKGYVGVRK
jgi:hypothetical protein